MMDSELLISTNMWIPAHDLAKEKGICFFPNLLGLFQDFYAAVTLSSAH